MAITVLTLLCGTWALPRWADWNQNSRLDLTVAIVDHRTLSIDCCVANTGDYAVFEGRTYSDKAPGLSFLAVPPYALWQAARRMTGLGSALDRAAHGEAMQGTLREEGTGLRADKIAFAAALALATMLVVSLPAAVTNAVMFRFLARFSTARGDRIAVALCYALATIAFPYAGNFYAHQLVAALLFCAFAIAHALPTAQRPQQSVFGIGLLLGSAAISEYPAVLIVAVLVVYVLYQGTSVRSQLAAALAYLTAGFLPPVILAAAYHWAIFHTPLPVAYRYSALWQERHAIGFMSISFPHLDALWGITFSPYRGLFLLCPVLLLSIAGMRELWRKGWQVEVVASGAAVVLFIGFNCSSVMWWGGFAIGPRYLVPMVPFLAWPLIGFLDAGDNAAWRRPLFAAAAVISFIQVWSLTYAGQHFPEESWKVPLRDYAWPELTRGNLARNVGMFMGLSGWWSLAPLAGACALVGGSWWIATRR